MGPPEVIWAHRCLTITIHTAAYGPLQIANLYQDVYATDDDKYSQLAHIWDRMRSRLGRPVVGGDYNMQPPQVRRWTQAISAAVLAPKATTCSTDNADTTLDFFVADSVLCMGQAKVEALLDLPCTPHRPVQLTFQGALLDQVVNIYQPPKPGATAPVCGPRRQAMTAQWAEWTGAFSRFWATHGDDKIPAKVPNRFWQEVQVLLDEWIHLAHAECQDMYGMEAAPCAADAARQTTLKELIQGRSHNATPAREMYWTARQFRELRNLCRQHPLKQAQRAHLATAIRRRIESRPWQKACEDFAPNMPMTARQALLMLGRMDAGDQQPSTCDELDRLLMEVTTTALEAQTAETRVAHADGRRQWDQFIETAFAGGAKIAHRCTKPAAPAQLDIVTAQDGYGSSLPTDVLQAEAAKWSKLWQATDAHQSPIPGPWTGAQLPPRLTAQQLRTAAKRFKPNTSAPDGMSPRQFESLTEPALSALAMLLQAFEYGGDFAPTLRSMWTALLPKPQGGHRPIGLFRAIFRLWARARRPEVDKWAHTYAKDGVFSMAPGRQATDAVWRAQVKAAATRGTYSLELNWDIQKCFEHVQRPKLIEVATQLGFPAHILRISLASYAWPRRLRGYQGLVTDPIHATRGIVAGSAFACYELIAYMYAATRAVLLTGPTLSVHVDDITLAITRARRAQCIHDFQRSAAALVVEFEQELGLPFEKEKATLIGTDQQLVAIAHKALGRYAGALPEGTAIRRLGVDHALTAAQTSRPVWRGRWTTAIARRRRIAMIKRPFPTRRNGVVFRCGVLPSLYYGAELETPPKAHLRKLRVWAMQAGGWPKTAAASMAPLWMAPKDDPICVFALRPLLRYHQEWWDTKAHGAHPDNLTALDLTIAYEEAQRRRGATQRKGRVGLNPVEAAIRAAADVDWEFISPTELKDDFGRDMDLLAGPPALLEDLFLAAWRRRACEEYRDARTDDVEWPSHPICGPHEADCNTARQVLTTQSKQCLAPAERRWLATWLSGTYVTKATMAKRAGDSVRLCTQCPAGCGGEDSVQHRLWICPCFAEQRARIIPETLATEALRQQAPPHLLAKGMIAYDPTLQITGLETREIECTIDGRRVDNDQLTFEPDTPIYGDGSCVEPTCPVLARAAFALWQRATDGTARQVVGTVEGPVQTASYAEHVAATHLTSHLQEPATYVTDCMSVIKAHQRGPHVERARLNTAHLWTAAKAHLLAEVAKTKAHRTKEEAEAQGDLEAFMGNAMVDCLCRDKAKARLPEQERIDSFRAQQALGAQLYRFVAKMLTLWEPLHHKALLATAEAYANRPKAPSRHKPHQYHYVQHRRAWVCQGCLKVRRGTRRPKPGNSCPDNLRRLGTRAARAAHLGHQVCIACPSSDPQSPLLFCRVCGAYGEQRFVNLGKPCPGHRPTLPALQRLQARQHPRLAGHTITRPRLACPQCLGGLGPHWCGHRHSAPPPRPALAIQDGQLAPERPAPDDQAGAVSQQGQADTGQRLWEPTADEGLDAHELGALGPADAEDEEDVFGHALDPNFDGAA